MENSNINLLQQAKLALKNFYNEENLAKNNDTDFSTKNHKNFSNFSKKAKQLWEKNQTEISKNFPYLALFADERKEFENIKITAFFSNGRAGSHFLHSLLDGYPKILTIPSYGLRYFFDPQLLNYLFPENIFSDINWKENLLQRFLQVFAMIFDGDTRCGYVKGFGKFIGFCEMGENGDEVLRVNKNAFKEFLLNELKDRTKISAPAFFILVHYAYEFALGRLGRLKQSQKFKQQKSVIFYHIHIFDSKYVQNFCFAFPNANYLTITREQLNMLEASLKMYMNATDPDISGTALANRAKPYDIFAHGGKFLSTIWEKIPQLFYSPRLFFELFLAFGFTKSATIRLEDIKDHPKTALINLLSWLGVENPTWHQSLETETFGGFLYAGATQNKIKGFDNSHLKKGQGTFFSQNDLRIMNLMLYPLAVKFGYRPKDNDYLKSEIDWYENVQKVETYMDFEAKIIGRLKQDFPNFESSEAMAPYYYRVKWAKRNLNYMKKYKEQCVGFADLLEI